MSTPADIDRLKAEWNAARAAGTDKTPEGKAIQQALVAAYTVRSVSAVSSPSAVSTLPFKRATGSRSLKPKVVQSTDARDPDGLSPDDFIFVGPQDKFLCAPTGELWTRQAVDGCFPTKGAKTSSVIMQDNRVEQMSWVPGHDAVIENTLIDDGGVKRKKGWRVANLYNPPQRPADGNPDDIRPWMDHLQFLYPDTYEHILDWFAHRVQKPGEKVNHALVFGGKQGIGKDTIIEPLTVAVGVDNFAEVSPKTITEDQFSGYLRAIVLRVSEARDMGNENRHAFYEAMKTIVVAPPSMLRVNEKHTKAYPIPNVVGVLFTTNHRDGLYLPEDDRRHHVSWADGITKEDFPKEYFPALYGWYHAGGFANVINFLERRDISGFDAMAPPPQTAAWRDMTLQSASAEDIDMASALEALGFPDVFAIQDVVAVTTSEHRQWLADRRNRRVLGHVLNRAGYNQVPNANAKSKLWKKDGKEFVIYGKESLSTRVRTRAVQDYLTP